MRRRFLLRLCLGAGAWFAVSGHTPYGHWSVYRRKHLMIGSCRTDLESYALAETVAKTLVRDLPESSARASRATNQRRVASLLASDQWQVAVMRRAEAADLTKGRGLFEPVGAVPLNSLFAMGDHLLVCRTDFPELHAFLVSGALTQAAADIPGGAAPGAGAIPAHPGALAYAQGRPPPPAPVAAEPESEADHGHAH